MPSTNPIYSAALLLILAVSKTLAFQCTRYVAPAEGTTTYPCGASINQPCEGLSLNGSLFNLAASETLCLLQGFYRTTSKLQLPLGVNLIALPPGRVTLMGEVNVSFVPPPDCVGKATSVLQGIIDDPGPLRLNVEVDNTANPGCLAGVQLEALDLDFGAVLSFDLSNTELQLRDVVGYGASIGWVVAKGPRLSLKLGFRTVAEDPALDFSGGSLLLSDSTFSKTLVIGPDSMVQVRNTSFELPYKQPAISLVSVNSFLNVTHCAFLPQSDSTHSYWVIDAGGSHSPGWAPRILVSAQRNWWSSPLGPKSCCQSDPDSFSQSPTYVNPFIDFSYWSKDPNFTKFADDDFSSCTSAHCPLLSGGGNVAYAVVVGLALVICIVGAVLIRRRYTTTPSDPVYSLQAEASERLLDSTPSRDGGETIDTKALAYLHTQSRLFNIATIVLVVCGLSVSAYAVFGQHCQFDDSDSTNVCVGSSSMAQVISALSVFSMNFGLALISLGLGLLLPRIWAAFLMLVVAFVGAAAQLILLGFLCQRFAVDSVIPPVIYFDICTSVLSSFCLAACVFWGARVLQVLEAPIMRPLKEQVSASQTLARADSSDLYRCNELRSTGNINIGLSFALPAISLAPVLFQALVYRQYHNWGAVVVPFAFLAIAVIHSLAVVICSRLYQLPFLALLCLVFQGTAIAGQVALMTIALAVIDSYLIALKAVYSTSVAIGGVIIVPTTQVTMLIRIWRFRNRVLTILPEAMAANISKFYIPPQYD